MYNDGWPCYVCFDIKHLCFIKIFAKTKYRVASLNT